MDGGLLPSPRRWGGPGSERVGGRLVLDPDAGDRLAVAGDTEVERVPRRESAGVLHRQQLEWQLRVRRENACAAARCGNASTTAREGLEQAHPEPFGAAAGV